MGETVAPKLCAYLNYLLHVKTKERFSPIQKFLVTLLSCKVYLKVYIRLPSGESKFVIKNRDIINKTKYLLYLFGSQTQKAPLDYLWLSFYSQYQETVSLQPSLHNSGESSGNIWWPFKMMTDAIQFWNLLANTIIGTLHWRLLNKFPLSLLKTKAPENCRILTSIYC